MDDENKTAEIEEDREEVREEIEDQGGETAEEAAEQRTDDYEGLSRKLDDLLDMVKSGLASLDEKIGALGVVTIENGASFNTGDIANEAADAAEETIGEILDIEDLDLL